MSDKTVSDKPAVEKIAAKDGGKAQARRNDVRSRGREFALQLLYSFEQNKFIDDGMLAPADTTDGMEAESIAFAQALQAGFAKERLAIDAAVDKRLENWTIHRLAVADRAILRLGAYEILYCTDTPAKVAINEYIELSKRYGSEAKTPKLVNAVLDKIAKEHRAGDVKAK
jgi:N utilization substance protein B